MMPDRIQITHQPKTMTTPTIRTALTSDEILPGPFSVDDLRRAWNQQADEHNQWDSLDSDEQLAWAQVQSIDADRARAAMKAKADGQRPTDEDLYDLAEQFNGDTVPAMRRALELWGNPLQGAPAPGENPAAQPAPVPVAWCRSDEFANSMNRGGSFNGWKDPGAGANKCDMQLYAIPPARPGASD